MLSTKIFFILFALLSLIRTQDDHDHEHEEQHHEEEEGHLTEQQIWGFGFLAGLAISIIGFLAAIIVLILKKFCSLTSFEVIIKFLFSLACGALLGDTLVHILAESFHSEKTQSSIVALIFICSVFIFLVLQKVFEAYGVSHSHCHEDEKQQKDKNLI